MREEVQIFMDIYQQLPHWGEKRKDVNIIES